jgi:2-dehydro-3-deoxyglucarate aldolase/4-hydroxy-2-oxoheptanedioate aldolase
MVTMSTRLKASLQQDKLVRVFCAGQLCHPKILEIVGLHGVYDAVWLDQEHVGLTIEQLEQATRAARAVGLDTFVRLAATDYATVMRPLEAGAGGVMAAQVRSAREAADVVRWAKFHPQGLRGVNGTGVDGSYGTVTGVEYMRRANAETLVAIQIEHADAVEDVDNIAAVPNVDVLFVGPADLAQSMGIPGEWNHPRIWQAIERVARAATAHRIHWAILPANAAYAQRCVELGCRMLSVGLDVWTLQRGLKAVDAEYAAVFGNVEKG